MLVSYIWSTKWCQPYFTFISEFSYKLKRFLLDNYIVKSDNKIGKCPRRTQSWTCILPISYFYHDSNNDVHYGITGCGVFKHEVQN